VEIGKYYSSDY